MALIWFRLHSLSRNLRLVNAALKAIDLVKLAQPHAQSKSRSVRRHPRLRSGPRLLYRRRRAELGSEILHRRIARKTARIVGAADRAGEACCHVQEPQEGRLCAGSASAPTRRLNTIMLTTVRSQKVRQMLSAWRGRDIGNLTVVVEHPAAEPAAGQAAAPLYGMKD